MTLNPGKEKGLGAVSNEREVIAALALDQRGSLAAMLEAASGQSPSPQAITEFKVAVTRALTPEASAVLLDLEYGRPGFSCRYPRTGLILAYEQDAYLNRHPQKLPQLIPGLSVKRLKEAGADAVKVLIHYTPFAPAEVNDVKQVLVEHVGAECRAEDVPFFLEVVGYEADGTDSQPSHYARRRPEVVISNMREFSQERYAVDMLKIEFPVDLKFVSGIQSFKGEKVYSLSEAIDFYRQAARVARKPFIYLSAGVSHQEFLEGLALAAEASVPYSGVLCGRATWQDGARIYAQQGLAALEKWLETDGIRNIRAINASLANAQPWSYQLSAISN